MRVLGISNEMYIASAALVEDGRVVAAAAEERFTREKHSRAFPAQAVDYCLSNVDGGLAAVDHVAISADPSIDLSVRNSRYAGRSRWYPEAFISVPNNLVGFMEGGFEGPTVHTFRTASATLDIRYVYHHLSHAASGFHLSAFERAAILTADGKGEDCSAAFGIGEGTDVRLLDRMPYPSSLGFFYGAVTQFLGFRMNRDEWKIMGLAAFGDRAGPAYERMRKLIRLRDDGWVDVDLNAFRYYMKPVDRAYAPAFVELFGSPRRPGDELDRRHADIAAAAQHVAEDAVAHMARALHARTGLPRLVVSGGLFMNSVINGRLAELTPFDEVFVSSCPDDSGTAIGAALHIDTTLGDGRPAPQLHNYYGPAFDDLEVEAALKRAKLPVQRSDDVVAQIAGELAAGRLVGWFQGRMEFGQRALGNRSILADPRDAAVRDIVNAAVKFREPFRPFAPALPAEDFHEYFSAGAVNAVPFMEKTLAVRPERRELIPAVVHVDGTARPQTVTADSNPLFHELLREFKRRTGVGVLLNTSFNLNDEPIVCTPTDAIRTFFSSGLDVLVLGHHVLAKPGGAVAAHDDLAGAYEAAAQR